MSDSNTLYQKPVKEVFEILKTSDKGLSNNEAVRRLKRYGKNELNSIISLTSTSSPTTFLIFLRLDKRWQA